MTPRDHDAIRLADAEARRAAQLDFDRPLALEAGAGTGKTATLVARVLTWALTRGWELVAARSATTPAPQEDSKATLARRIWRGVVAITFTEKAAAEMSERIGSALADLLNEREPPGLSWDSLGGATPESKARAAALIEGLDSVRVHTIHAFCRSILAENPLAAGLHPNFQIDAGYELTLELANRAVDAWMAENAEGGFGESLRELIEARLGPLRWRDALYELSLRGVPSAALGSESSTGPFSGPRWDAWLAALVDALQSWQRGPGPTFVIAKGSLKSAKTTAEALAEWTQRLEALRSNATDLTLEALLEATESSGVDSKVRDRLGKWAAGELGKTEEKVCPDPEALLRTSAALLGPLSELLTFDPLLVPLLAHLRGLLETLEESRRTHGVVSFDEILSTTRRVLVDQPVVAKSIRSGIDQLLVDEFQDTDPVQCEIVRTLAFGGPPDENPGLFVVGDPKQSIYGWRSADLVAYDTFVSDLIARGGEKYSLSVNFRSVAPILTESTRIFDSLMPSNARPPESVPFQPLLPSPHLAEAPGFIAEGYRPVEGWVAARIDEDGMPTTEGHAAALREQEASAIAADLAILHRTHGVDWNDMALLFRSTGSLPTYIEALRRYQVPHTVDRSVDYYRRREVIDALSLVQAIFDPHDAISLMAWLRSPAVGVPDAAWPALKDAGLFREMVKAAGSDPETRASFRSLVETARRAVDPNAPGLEHHRRWPESLIQALDDLAALRRMAHEAPLHTLLDTVRTRTWHDALEGLRYQGASRVGALHYVWNQLIEVFAERPRPIPEVLEDLRERLRRGGDPNDSSPADDAAEAVRLMTVHKSKGLAFTHVYLVDIQTKPRPTLNAPPFGAQRIDGAWELSLFGMPTLRWSKAVEREKAIASGEQVRTLYVALTRARQRVVVTGGWSPETAEAGAPATAARRSYADLLAHRSSAHLLLRGGSDGARLAPSQRVADKDNRLWRWAIPSEVAGMGGRLPDNGLPSRVAERLRLAERSRLQRIAAAEQRMARAVVATATSRKAHDPEPDGSPDHDPSNGPDPSAAPEQAAAERAGSGPVVDRQAAMLVGTWVHDALERLDPSLAPEDARAAAATRIRALAGPADEAALAIAAADEHLQRFFDSELYERFRHVEILGREVSFIDSPDLRESATAPVGAYLGQLDLLIRDPESGDIIVVDYKTDRVSGADLTTRAEGYRGQLETYVHAVSNAVGPDSVVRGELWFLWAGKRIELH